MDNYQDDKMMKHLAIFASGNGTNCENIINLDVWSGGLEEQSMIADYLDEQVQIIIYLIGKCELAIKLLQERRTALISAAVTGKIDVRNWQNPTEAKMEFSA